MYDIDELPTFIPLGNQRDFGHTVTFDVSAWDDLLPDRYELTYIRPTETAVNPAVGIVYDATAKTVTWTIGAEVTDISGSGSLVIEAYHGAEQLTHSAAIQTVVGEGHGAVGVAPEPLTNWLEDATAALDAIKGATFTITDGELEVTI